MDATTIGRRVQAVGCTLSNVSRPKCAGLGPAGCFGSGVQTCGESSNWGGLGGAVVATGQAIQQHNTEVAAMGGPGPKMGLNNVQAAIERSESPSDSSSNSSHPPKTMRTAERQQHTTGLQQVHDPRECGTSKTMEDALQYLQGFVEEKTVEDKPKMTDVKWNM